MLYENRTEVVPEVPATEEWKEILIKARALINGGWTKGFLRHGENVCLVGALALVSGGLPSSIWASEKSIQQRKALKEPVARLRSALQRRTKIRGLWVYNDHYTTTKQDILSLIDDALTG